MNQFIKMSKYAGMREDLVQAGGGNASVKISKNEMLIKASGVQLADISASEGYAVVNPLIIKNFFEDADINNISKENGKEIIDKSFLREGRPSIETFLHAITDTYTLHTHPTLVNVLTAREGGMNILGELFPQALLINYATPGIDLAKEYFATYTEERNDKNQIFEVIFLKNHGLIVSAQTGEEVIKITEDVIKKVAKYLEINITPTENVTRLYNSLCEIDNNTEDIIYLSDNSTIYECMNDFTTGVWEHYFAPDCLVYCGKRFLSLSEEYSINDFTIHMSGYGKPVIILLNRKIYIVAQSMKKAKEIESVLSFSVQVASLNRLHNMDLLSDSEQDFLLNWNAEKYRQSLK